MIPLGIVLMGGAFILAQFDDGTALRERQIAQFSAVALGVVGFTFIVLGFVQRYSLS